MLILCIAAVPAGPACSVRFSFWLGLVWPALFWLGSAQFRPCSGSVGRRPRCREELHCAAQRCDPDQNWDHDTCDIILCGADWWNDKNGNEWLYDEQHASSYSSSCSPSHSHLLCLLPGRMCLRWRLTPCHMSPKQARGKSYNTVFKNVICLWNKLEG